MWWDMVVIIACAYVTSKVVLEANGSKCVHDNEDVFRMDDLLWHLISDALYQ